MFIPGRRPQPGSSVDNRSWAGPSYGSMMSPHAGRSIYFKADSAIRNRKSLQGSVPGDYPENTFRIIDCNRQPLFWLEVYFAFEFTADIFFYNRKINSDVCPPDRRFSSILIKDTPVVRSSSLRNITITPDKQRSMSSRRKTYASYYLDKIRTARCSST